MKQKCLDVKFWKEHTLPKITTKKQRQDKQTYMVSSFQQHTNGKPKKKKNFFFCSL